MSAFEKLFLENYLKFGLGSMSKSDIDALVIHLLDRYGTESYEPFSSLGPLSNLKNQQASERLKAPVSRIKKLRYEAALKFEESLEMQAKGRLLASLRQASLETQNDGGTDRVHLIIEDALAKNWLQGKLKEERLIFDGSFNTEIIKVNAEHFFEVLAVIFESKETDGFIAAYKAAKNKKAAEDRKAVFRRAATKFVEGAAKQAGAGVVAVFKAHLGSP